MSALTDWIDAAKARADAATEFDWNANDRGQVTIAHAWGHDVLSPDLPADAEFIAAARTDLPKALDALRAVLDLTSMPAGTERFLVRKAQVRNAIATALGVTHG